MAAGVNGLEVRTMLSKQQGERKTLTKHSFLIHHEDTGKIYPRCSGPSQQYKLCVSV